MSGSQMTTVINMSLLIQWFDEYHIHAPLRKHVEGGRIVDYDDLPMGAGWDEIKVVTPAGWEYTEDDL